MKNRKYLVIALLILVSLLPLLNLLTPGFPVTHDGQDHIVRIANFYQNLKERNIIPRWAGNLNWGYGHPILMFLYPASSYSASLFHFFGLSLIDSAKLVFGLAFVLSGISMYLWIRNFLGSFPSFLTSVLYLFAPYRFIDLYVRGAIGEHVAFVFPPLVLLFLYKLSKKYSSFYVVGGALSLAGLILSHNAISLMFLPLIIFYFLFLLFFLKNKKVFTTYFFFLFLLGFGLASFFWAPAFFEGKYTLRNIVTAGEYASRFVNLKDLFYGQWNYGGTGEFTVQIGIINIILFVLSPLLILLLFKKKDKNLILISGILLYSLVVIFLMLSQSNFIWERFIILQNFQFPWRFLSVLVFTTAVLGGFIAQVIFKKIRVVLCIFLIVATIFLTRNYWSAESYKQNPAEFFTGVYYGTTDTGESAPVWSIRFMEHIPKAPIEVISGNAEIKQVERKTTVHKYEIVASDKARIRENTLYFPGWNVFIDGKPVGIEFQDPLNRGLITFFIEEGTHKVDILFTETKLRLIADIISIISLVLLLSMLFIKKPIWRCFR